MLITSKCSGVLPPLLLAKSCIDSILQLLSGLVLAGERGPVAE
jgi:hypothetical protein